MRIHLGVFERRARGFHTQVGGEFACGRDMALTDAGALHDPFVGCVDGFRKIRVGKDALRQIAATAEYDGTCHDHEAAPSLAASSRAWRTRVSRILLSSPWR